MSQFINLATATEMTLRFRENSENLLKPEFQNQQILPNNETFDRSVIETLLNKPGCSQIRVYSGLDDTLKLHSLIVAVDENGNDIITVANGESTSDEEEDIVENGFRCPPICKPGSPLNP